MSKNDLRIIFFIFWFFLINIFDVYCEEASSAPAINTYNKAVRLYESQNWDAAKDYFHEYLAEYSDTPLYVTCLYYLAFCYQKLGNKEQAVILYHKVIDQAQGPDAFWADMAQNRIQEILSNVSSTDE